ncbi:MAG: hypothetical protein AB8B83_06575 [Bdellovibrionales bacterium]
MTSHISHHNLHSSLSTKSESGNVLFMILIAVALIGFLTAAVTRTNRTDGANIDGETLVLRASEVQRYASELERAVNFIMQNGFSENSIRFAHYNAHADYGDLGSDSDTRDQVFHRDGGGASYRAPPAGVNDGSQWEFYGGTHIPGMGRSDRPELVAVLPYVTQAFCDRINDLNNQSGSMSDNGNTTPSATNAGECVNMGAIGRFDNSTQFYSTAINTMNEASTSFEHDPNTSAARPAQQGCVICSRDTNGDGSLTDELHFYHVLMTR